MVKKSHNTKYLREINAQLEKRAKQSEESKRLHYHSEMSREAREFAKFVDRKDLKADKRKAARESKK